MATFRPVDQVRVEVETGNQLATFDRFTSLEISADLTGPSEAAFECGDDGTFGDLRPLIAHGNRYRIYINDRLQMTGRVEMLDVPIDGAGATVRFVVRTKLADAMYASAEPKTRVKGVTLKQFLLDLYKPLGYTESDFVFDADVSRNLITGVSKSSGTAPVDLEAIKEENAKIDPPESIYAAADRHLRRHGFLHWDSADGKIVVGTPDDEQFPLYFFKLITGPESRFNNLLRANRVQDWSDLATRIGVFGTGGKKDYSKASIRGFAEDAEMTAAGFYRPIIIVADGIKKTALAERAARRELSARSKRKDAWDLTFDGLAYWDGYAPIPFAINTTCELETSAAGGPAGAYYVHRVVCRLNASDAATTQLSVVAKGVWEL